MKSGYKKRKKPFTLLEIMIVICIIGMITGVIGFNMKGTLNKSRAYKTETVMRRVKDLLDLEIAMANDNKIVEGDKWKTIIQNSGLFKDPAEFCRDGWGGDLRVAVGEGDNVIISSVRYDEYCTGSGRTPITQN